MLEREKLQTIIEEIKNITQMPLTDYASAKLFAFPMSAIKKASDYYHQQKCAGFEKLYSLCREATFLENIKPNTSRAKYLIESLKLSFTDGDFVVPPKVTIKLNNIKKRQEEEIKKLDNALNKNNIDDKLKEIRSRSRMKYENGEGRPGFAALLQKDLKLNGD